MNHKRKLDLFAAELKQSELLPPPLVPAKKKRKVTSYKTDDGDIGMLPETKFAIEHKIKTNTNAKKRRKIKTKDQNVFTAGTLQNKYQSKSCVYQPYLLKRMITCCNADTVVIGMDISLSSPAITVMDISHNIFHVYFLWSGAKPLRKDTLTWISGPWMNWNWEFHASPATYNDHDTEVRDAKESHCIYRYRRMGARLEWIKNIINEWKEKCSKMIVGIEHYSFGSSSTQYASAAITNMALTELGGCIRMFLCKQQGVQCLELPPMGIKKSFSNSGKSDKHDMYQAYLQRHNGPPLDEVFPFTKPISEYSVEPPSPVSDIIDSLAVAYLTAHCAANMI